MMKTFERSLLLHVGKMVVPFKFSNQGDPLGTKRKKGDQAKRSNNLGAGAGQRWPVRDSCAFFRDPGRRHQFQSHEFSASARRHDSWQVAGIGEEKKDPFNRDRHPLFELRQMDHTIQATLQHAAQRAVK
jgi:hypothetical protein